VLRIGLDRKEEQPELHEFKGNPVEKVRSDRGRYLSAALTVVRAYIVAGKPGRLPWIGDPFGAWSDLVRSALVWLGRADPVETMAVVRANDPSRLARAAVFQAIYNAYGSEPRTAGQMVSDAKAGSLRSEKTKILERKPGQEAVDLREALTQYTSDRLDSQYLGNKLNTDLNRITNGLVLRKGTYKGKAKTNTWFVEPA
jgi:putative DNA primase/helicase